MPLGFWGAGSIVGASITQVFPYEIECLTTVQAQCHYSGEPLPSNILLSHLAQSQQLLQILHCHRVETRLEQFIGWFAAMFGKQHSDGIHLKAHLTHQQLSEAIGVTRVTVTRLLGKLAQEGKIVWSRNQQIVSQQLLQSLIIGI